MMTIFFMISVGEKHLNWYTVAEKTNNRNI